MACAGKDKEIFGICACTRASMKLPSSFVFPCSFQATATQSYFVQAILCLGAWCSSVLSNCLGVKLQKKFKHTLVHMGNSPCSEALPSAIGMRMLVRLPLHPMGRGGGGQLLQLRSAINWCKSPGSSGCLPPLALI